jgi:hypothetical protein
VQHKCIADLRQHERDGLKFMVWDGKRHMLQAGAHRTAFNWMAALHLNTKLE